MDSPPCSDEDWNSREQPVLDILPSRKKRVKCSSQHQHDKVLSGCSPSEESLTPTRLSKKARRKLEQLERKASAKEKRAAVFAELEQYKLDSGTLELLQPSFRTSSPTDYHVTAKPGSEHASTLERMQKVLKARAKRDTDGEQIAFEKQQKRNQSTTQQNEDNCQRLDVLRDTLAKGCRTLHDPKRLSAPLPQGPELSERDPGEQQPPLWRRSALKYYDNPPALPRSVDIEKTRLALPVVSMEQEIVDSVLNFDVTLISGSTGSGKSTQVPQMLYESGFCCTGSSQGPLLIGVTEPRRVATISVARRVALEMGSPQIVGYQVRFDKTRQTETTRVKFMTDGILLREIQLDFLLSRYGVIIIDEAHERSVNCDILLGLVSRIVRTRRERFEQRRTDLPPLKIVVMSATLRQCDFTDNPTLFSPAPPVVSVHAKTHPVTIHFNKVTPKDFMVEAKNKVMKIHEKLPPGSILVFVTGQREVTRLVSMLNTVVRRKPHDSEVLEATASPGNISFPGVDWDPRKLVLPKTRCSDAPIQTSTSNHSVEDEATSSDSEGGEAEYQETDNEGCGTDIKEASDKPPCEPKNPPEADSRNPVDPSSVFTMATSLDDGQEEATGFVHGEAAVQGQDGLTVLDLSTDELAKALGFTSPKGKAQQDAVTWSGSAGALLTAIPLYAALSSKDQLKAFKEPRQGERIVVVATNVAESSVTLPNIRYVVDAGKEKQRKFRQASGVSYFETCWISKANADQRAGRAGRIGPGHCFRLYSSSVYQNVFHAFPPVEMLRVPLEGVLLFLASMGIPHPVLFPFPTPPSSSSLKNAKVLLESLGALYPSITRSEREREHLKAGHMGSANALRIENEKNAGRITKIGKAMCRFPIAPRYARMLLQLIGFAWNAGGREETRSRRRKSDAGELSDPTLAADNFTYVGCLVFAALSVGSSVFDQRYPVRRNRSSAHGKVDGHEQAHPPSIPFWTRFPSDVDGLMWIVVEFCNAKDKTELCRANVLSSKKLEEVVCLASQLCLEAGKLLRTKDRREAVTTTGFPIVTMCRHQVMVPFAPTFPSALQRRRIHAATLVGLMDHLALKLHTDRHNDATTPKGAYQTTELPSEIRVFLSSQSNLYYERPRPELVAYNHVIGASAEIGIRYTMRECFVIDDLGTLAKQATPLVDRGAILPFPSPSYHPDTDCVMGYCKPKIRGLSVDLPTTEVPVPVDNPLRYRVFAVEFLQGNVYSSVSKYLQDGCMINLEDLSVTAAKIRIPALREFISHLESKGVASRRELESVWKGQDDSGKSQKLFLLVPLLKLTKPDIHKTLRSVWPLL